MLLDKVICFLNVSEENYVASVGEYSVLSAGLNIHQKLVII